MTVILVLAMFVAFFFYEYFTNRQFAECVIPAAARSASPPRLAPWIVAGYEVPEQFSFHTGHAWALRESPGMVRTGVDDFAAKLIGNAEEVNLPQRGQWIRQGQKIWSFRVNGELVEMVSPVEGTVVDVNGEVARRPNTMTADPYGKGWLMTVQSPDAKTNFRNLLTGSMARSLIADSARKLHSYIPAMQDGLALAQDGGKAMDGIAGHLPADKYVEITREFFLT